MARRAVVAALCFCLATLVTGCVEITQIITLNPDGRGKMKIEVVAAAFDFDMGALIEQGEKKKPKTLDELKQDAVTKFLRDATGITAFKDVSVNWTREGKLHMVATCYFNQLDDLASDSKGPKDPTKVDPASSFRSTFKQSREKDGTVRITMLNKGVEEGIKPLNEEEPLPDFAKLSDKEVDEFLLKQRVDFQKVRPMMEMMLNDLKVKLVLHLPGEIVEAKGFKKDDGRSVSFAIEGRCLARIAQKGFDHGGFSIQEARGWQGPEGTESAANAGWSG